MFNLRIMSSCGELNTTVMTVSPNDMTTEMGFESVKRQVKIFSENVVTGATDAGPLIVNISDNTGMDAADTRKMQHCGAIDDQTRQRATFRHSKHRSIS
jgi:hypothetical protein